MTNNCRSLHLVLSQLARNENYKKKRRKKTIFTNKILGVLLHNKDLDLQLGTASHQWEEKGQLTVNVPKRENLSWIPTHGLCTHPIFSALLILLSW